MKKFLTFYYKAQTYFIVIGFAAMVLVTFFQVVNRTVTQFNVSWPEEVARYLIVWTAFVAAIAAFRKGSMISIDLLSSHFNPFFTLVSLVFRNVVTIVFALVAALYSLTIIQLQLETGQVSPALSINMAIPYSAVPVWGILTAIELSVSTVWEVFAYRKKRTAV